MQPLSQTFPVVSFLGVVAQFGGDVMIVSLFVMLRQFVLRRVYFTAWAWAWAALSLAMFVLVLRYILAPDTVAGTSLDGHPVVWMLYFIYQLSKGIGFAFLLRGTLAYVGGAGSGVGATRGLLAAATLFALASTLASHHGLDEMVVWQSAIAVPAFGYCALALLWLPRSQRTLGSIAAGACFAVLGALWLAYAGAFALAINPAVTFIRPDAAVIVGYNAYLDLVVNVLLGYAMILILMEDAKREVAAAQAELHTTHERLRHAALYDVLTDSLNRRAFAEGIGLDMVRATFGTVVVADVDNLKVVNDRFGHAAGDQVLRRCADILRPASASYDKLYRWGGDEFLLIITSARASDVLERLTRAVDAAEAVEAGAPLEAIPVRVSLGASDYASSEELTSAIERADRAMYAEKHRRKVDRRDATDSAPPGAVSIVE